MAYFGVIFFANMGGGGGQNYFHKRRKKTKRTKENKRNNKKGTYTNPIKHFPREREMIAKPGLARLLPCLWRSAQRSIAGGILLPVRKGWDDSQKRRVHFGGGLGIGDRVHFGGGCWGLGIGCTLEGGWGLGIGDWGENGPKTPFFRNACLFMIRFARSFRRVSSQVWLSVRTSVWVLLMQIQEEIHHFAGWEGGRGVPKLWTNILWRNWCFLVFQGKFHKSKIFDNLHMRLSEMLLSFRRLRAWRELRIF